MSECAKEPEADSNVTEKNVEASVGKTAKDRLSYRNDEARDRVTENDIWSDSDWSSVSYFSVEAGDGGHDRVLSVEAGDGGDGASGATAWTANDDGHRTGSCGFQFGLRLGANRSLSRFFRMGVGARMGVGLSNRIGV